jgi:hypothetical protein
MGACTAQPIEGTLHQRWQLVIKTNNYIKYIISISHEASRCPNAGEQHTSGTKIVAQR